MRACIRRCKCVGACGRHLLLHRRLRVRSGRCHGLHTSARMFKGGADLGPPPTQKGKGKKKKSGPAPGRAGKAGCASTCASAARAASARSAAACCFSACSSITRRKAACTRATALAAAAGGCEASLRRGRVVATRQRLLRQSLGAHFRRRCCPLRPLWALISCHLHERRLCVCARVELGLLRSATPGSASASLARGRPSGGAVRRQDEPRG